MTTKWNPMGLSKNRRRRLSRKAGKHSYCKGKRKYRDKEEINDAIAALKRQSNARLRGYFCIECRGFHLTSKDALETQYASVDPKPNEAKSNDSVRCDKVPSD
jgi:hypothetical protein